jgi:hypothetical protein
MRRAIEHLTGTFRLPSDFTSRLPSDFTSRLPSDFTSRLPSDFTFRGARCRKQSNRVMADTLLDPRGA